MHPKVSKTIGADGRVSENKSPGVKAPKPLAKSGGVKSLKSDRQADRYPGAVVRGGCHECVYGALDNLLFPDSVDGSYPAPIGTSNLFVASSQVAGSEIVCENYLASSTLFENYIIQTGDPSKPYYRTCSRLFTYEADYVTLEVNAESGGLPMWGVITSSNPAAQSTCNGVLNDFNTVSICAWPVQTTNIGQILQVVDPSPDAAAGDFTCIALDQNKALFGSANSDATGTCLLTLAGLALTNQNVWFGIRFNVPKSKRLLTIIAGFGGAALSSFSSPYNLKSRAYADYQYIATRSDKVRTNCQEMVITSTIANLYEGGNILMSKIVSNSAPAILAPLTWDAFLYAQKKKYLSNLEFGGHSMWFPSSNQWLLGSDYGQNPLVANTVTNMIHIVYPSPNGVAVPNLPIQVKINGWIDYTTNDTTIPTVPGIVFIDDWLTSVSILEACFQFTDNPTHTKFKEAISKAVKFITGGSPYAKALRSAGMAAIKTGLGAALMI